MTGALLNVVVVGGILAILFALVRSSWLGQRRWQPARWAEEMGVLLTAGNERFIRSYIDRTRVMRLAGGLIGLFLPPVYVAYAGEALPQPFDFNLFDALVGYLLGVVLAELTFKRPKGEVPAATLSPRDLVAYLPSAWTKTLRGAALVALVLIPALYALPRRERLVESADLLPWWMLAVMIVSVVLGVELLQRFIVRRPQPAIQDDLVEADDAIRSASVHALAGAGIALQLVIVSVEIMGIGIVSDLQILRWTLPWIGVLCAVAALASWMHITRPDNWQVRRGHGAQA
jgi:hypothetical protein